jgi:hypothetical protein
LWTAFLFFLQFPADPLLQVFHGIGADTELDEMQVISALFLFLDRDGQKLRPLATCAPTVAATSVTTPSPGARRACSIFIASTTATRWPL